MEPRRLSEPSESAKNILRCAPVRTTVFSRLGMSMKDRAAEVYAKVSVPWQMTKASKCGSLMRTV